MALNTFKYINVYYNKGDKKPYDVNGKPIAYLGQDFVGANEATIVRFYIGSDTGVINAVADVKRPDGEKAFALLDKVNTAEGVAWEFPLTDWFCAKAGKLTIAFKAFNGVVTIVNNTIESNNLRVIVSDIFNIDIGYAPNSVEDAPPFDPNDVATFINALSGKLDKVSGINVVEALPTPTDGSLNGRWFLLKSDRTVFPYIESSESIIFSATTPNPIDVNPGDYWYNPTINVLSFAINIVTWVPITSTNGTTTPVFGDSAGLRFVNTFSFKLFITETLLLKDIGRLYVFNFNTPVEVELGVETLKLKSTGNGEVTADTAKLSWNQPNGTVNVGLYNDVNVGVGEDVIYYVKATGAITKGDVIQYAGFQGDHALAKRAVQSEINANPKLIMGIAKQNITNGDFGYVAHFGKLEGVDTKGFEVDSFVWFDSAGSTAGNWTITQPTAPNAKILLAVIIKAESSAEANNGILLVRPTIEPKLEELQNVLITSIANGQVLRWNATNSRWENTGALTTAESNITNLQGRMTAEEANVDNLQGRMTSAEGDIDDIESGATIVPRALGDQNGNTINTTYLTQSSASATYIPLSQKAQPNGVATLGADGRVIPSQIPGIVSSVEEYDTLEDFPEVGVLTTVYLALDTGLTYLWSGSSYVALSSSLALGETSTTAYRGDRGKEAYDYSQVGHLPLAGGTVTGNLVVGGDLTISGTTTTIDTETVGIKDNIILINSNQTGIPSSALKGGLEIERGDLTNFQFVFDESDDRFKVGQVGSLQTVATRTDDGTIANRGITFFNTSTNRLENNANIVIDSDNRVGIGTASPITQSKLDVNGSINLDGTTGTKVGFAISDTFSADSTTIGHYGLTTAGGSGLWLSGFFGLKLATAGAERMRITSTGNVGIGTPSPSTPLSVVVSDVPAIQIRRNSSANNASASIGFRIATSENQANIAEVRGIRTNRIDSGDADITFLTSSAGATVTEKMRIRDDGNVGIGTSSPVAPLQVATADATLYQRALKLANGSTTNGSGAYIEFPSTTVDNTGSRIGGGREDSGGASFIKFDTTNSSTVNLERMRITSTGNVGIGTPSPGQKLDVRGTSAGRVILGNFSNDTSAGGTEVGIRLAHSNLDVCSVNLVSKRVGANAGADFLVELANGVGTITERLRITEDGIVGIGTTTMYRTGLNVVSGGNGGQIAIRHPNQTGNKHWYIGVEGSNDIVNFYADNGQGVYMTRGATAWSANSDERLKTDLIPITDALNKLNTLRTVTGRYKKDEVGKSRSFLLAQDVLKVFPEAVDIKDDEDKTLGLRYSELVPLLIKGIQELKSELDELKAKVG
jgi:hypothetical protein